MTTFDIAGALRALPQRNVTVLGTLAVITHEPAYAERFKGLLLSEVRAGGLLDRGGSVKAWQFSAAVRAHYYVQVSQRYPELFADAETRELIRWFGRINKKVFDVALVDYAYALVFRHRPYGPYDNQEIGVGLLAVLSHILAGHNPGLAARDRAFIAKHAVGWRDNFRNPDDGIVYHQQLWIQNAYLLALYAGFGEAGGENSRQSFDWILAQWPSNGMSPAYNVLNTNTPFDVMVLGAALFDDASYRWLAERMAQRDAEQGTLAGGTELLGAERWDSSLASQQPRLGSCYLKAPTGITPRPGAVQPDKIVMREGWEEDDLYALINLRFAGWHGYKATNTVVTLMAGSPFVVTPMEKDTISWLPKAGAQQVDRRIDRARLNGFQVKSDGLERAVVGLTRLGSAWRQDVPRFAKVLSFHTSDQVDVSRTAIDNWGGWDHERTIVLAREGYIAVLDHIQGGNGDAAINWFLKGEAEFGDGRIDLLQGDDRLHVRYVTDRGDKATIVKSDGGGNTHHAHDVHQADLELRFDAADGQARDFLTVFSKDATMHLDTLEVTGTSGHKVGDAFAVRLSSITGSDLIARNGPHGLVRFGNVSTDGGFLYLRERDGSLNLSTDGASETRIALGVPVALVQLNGAPTAWSYESGEVVIRGTPTSVSSH